MKLVEALQLLQQDPPAGAPTLSVFLVCGGTPLHLQTFLAAHLRRLDPSRRVAVRSGLFDDCLGSLERLRGTPLDGVAVVLEWSDFDPRLGLRQLGGWGPRHLNDILNTVRLRADRYQDAIGRVRTPVALCLPTLPLPPVAFHAGEQAGAFHLELQEVLSLFAARAAQEGNVKVVNSQRLDRVSPPGERLDVQSALLSGFPYKVPHACALAELLARLLRAPAPKKGLITDLDDTLWAGLVGEVGPDGVSWDLDHRSQLHGLYQQLLRSLADAGVLIGVASKNDPALVQEAFRRSDLLLPAEQVFPFEVHWKAKSESVARILKAWNVGADSVVFVDDSPLELAEVQAAHPGTECLTFPKKDYQAAYQLLERLRDLFGKAALSEEDGIRLHSLRQAVSRHDSSEELGGTPDEFLEQARAELTLSYCKEPAPPRALELVNKTNQFNLNGRRHTEGGWQQLLQDPDRFLLTADYKDKFGPLGKIAVLSGCRRDGELLVDVWVMSCRAFARRIEHRCLEQLFERFEVEAIAFEFEATPRNGPLQEFLTGLLGRPPEPGCRLGRGEFAAGCPSLPHAVLELAHG